jgi:hypothetical protein
MKKMIAIVLLLGAAGLFAPRIAAAAADNHAIVETTRTYRDMTRKSTEEFWSRPDRSLWRLENYLWITRKDLGVLWGVSSRSNEYMEEKLTSTPAAGISAWAGSTGRWSRRAKRRRLRASLASTSSAAAVRMSASSPSISGWRPRRRPGRLKS